MKMTISQTHLKLLSLTSNCLEIVGFFYHACLYFLSHILKKKNVRNNKMKLNINMRELKKKGLKNIPVEIFINMLTSIIQKIYISTGLAIF